MRILSQGYKNKKGSWDIERVGGMKQEKLWCFKSDKILKHENWKGGTEAVGGINNENWGNWDFRSFWRNKAGKFWVV